MPDPNFLLLFEWLGVIAVIVIVIFVLSAIGFGMYNAIKDWNKPR